MNITSLKSVGSIFYLFCVFLIPSTALFTATFLILVIWYSYLLCFVHFIFVDDSDKSLMGLYPELWRTGEQLWRDNGFDNVSKCNCRKLQFYNSKFVKDGILHRVLLKNVIPDYIMFTLTLKLCQPLTRFLTHHSLPTHYLIPF